MCNVVASAILTSLGNSRVLQPCLESLKYLPEGVRLHYIPGEGMPWAQAINKGIEESEGDIIIIDDDIILLPDTFHGLESLYPYADIFGFKLFLPEGGIQHAGGLYNQFENSMEHIGTDREVEEPEVTKSPYYTCHCTTSLIWIKRPVIEKIGGMAEDLPAMYFEDVDFSFRALKAGFHILYTALPAIHGHGVTKRQIVDAAWKAGRNWEEIKKRHLEDPWFKKEISQYPRKMGEEEEKNAVGM